VRRDLNITHDLSKRPAVSVGSVRIGGDAPLALIAGPCVAEGLDMALRTAEALCEITARHGVPLVFKTSFDKANRTSIHSFRGPGMDEGLKILRAVRERFDVPVTTDVHLPEQARPVADAVDLLQIPAFLCRQTDLLVACAETGLPVNVKKGQFVAPSAMGPAIEKLEAASGVLVTERGTTFGHGDLVVDYRSIPILHDLGVPVVFDATHSVQRPAGGGSRTTAERRFVSTLARAAVAAGADAIFAEVHPDPTAAKSDADSQLSFEMLAAELPMWIDCGR